jgi:prepilin-type N-terminal cleavage/methylation domain-containing protein
MNRGVKKMGGNAARARGFTLIEILVVIGLIAILAAVVLVAINPARQFAQARNSQRESNVETLLNAIGQNLADNKGIFTCGTVSVPTSATHIGTGSGLVDLTCLTPTYIPSAIPADPKDGTAADTQYTIMVDTNGRYTIAAPEAELGQTISSTR